MRDHKISQRRVRDLVGVEPRTVRRERPPDHADILKKMHEIAGIRRRFAYRRVGILLGREGFTMNEKKLYRLYKEEGLSARRRRGRKRARGTRVPMPISNRPNVRWSLNPRHGHSGQWRIQGSRSDTFNALRKFRVLAVNDDWVILPFLTGCIRRIHAAIFSFCAGVTPPMPMFGRSLL